MKFKIKSKFKPAGDQPKAIEQLVKGLKQGEKFQTLLGVTGSGKTFTVANVIEKVQKPTLVIAHNKTLAAQLCNEFREVFPDNAVEYFVSYYDYYQPEAYLPGSDTYIEKEAMINDEIDRLRHAATQALLTRKDVIIVASVSCIYGLGAPEAYEKIAIRLRKGQTVTRADLFYNLIDMQFTRTNADLKRGNFRWRSNTLEVMPANQEVVYRIEMPGQTVEKIFILDPVTRNIKEESVEAMIFPAKHFVALKEDLQKALASIRAELKDRLAYFKKQGKVLEEERLSQRTRYDLEMIEQIGFCHGIENYSRHLSGRAPGEPPDTLFSYFPDDYLFVIDESHVTIPQLSGMYEGDAARKRALIEHGFRLPSAADNRPLKFSELEKLFNQVIFTSATPGKYEHEESGKVVEQIIRPTGLIDPEIIIRPITPVKPGDLSQVDDLIERIKEKAKKNERVLVTTLTKKMAEDLSAHFEELKIKARYLHSDIDTLDRIGILTDFRRGKFDVLIGVNLLREGLDLPEVTLVAILDADKEGFLRSETSLIQTIGRAARNVNGQVVLYADNITGSIRRAVGETNRRRALQIAYNKKHGITPKTVVKRIKDITEGIGKRKEEEMASRVLALEAAAESKGVEEIIREKEKQMKEAANNLQFELAAVLRDEVKLLRKNSK
ncbi:excinuclease ABC subunit UvrB [Candidatus Uhrbacteria bacterium]|nr:excinuclease ABC subunit UvrB [Candidatus Uhrbacteria bacterium]